MVSLRQAWEGPRQAWAACLLVRAGQDRGLNFYNDITKLLVTIKQTSRSKICIYTEVTPRVLCSFADFKGHCSPCLLLSFPPA